MQDTAFGEQRQQTRAALNDALALVEQLKALQASDITKLMEGWVTQDFDHISSHFQTMPLDFDLYFAASSWFAVLGTVCKRQRRCMLDA